MIPYASGGIMRQGPLPACAVFIVWRPCNVRSQGHRGVRVSNPKSGLVVSSLTKLRGFRAVRRKPPGLGTMKHSIAVAH